jgi:hypothetical protein
MRILSEGKDASLRYGWSYLVVLFGSKPVYIDQDPHHTELHVYNRTIDYSW